MTQAVPDLLSPPPRPDESQRLAALRAGDEAAFLALVEQYHAALVRLATTYVGNPALAEDVAQETWVRALRGLERFEGRSSLKTWLFRILTNTALTYAKRAGREVTFSDLAGNDDEPAVEPEKFLPASDPDWAGHWAAPPQPWPAEGLEGRVERRELLRQVEAAIADLPPNQRAVITLHDVEGWAASDICNVLGLSETNQRVLLHRARARVRRALARFIEAERSAGEPTDA